MEKMIIVKNSGAVMHTPHGVLVSGENKMEARYWEAMVKMPQVKKAFEAKRLTLGEAKKDDKKKDDKKK